MPKVFHGVEIPEQIVNEISAKYGPEWTVGHILAFLLEREISRWAKENNVMRQEPIETPETCWVIRHIPTGKYVCWEDGEDWRSLTLGESRHTAICFRLFEHAEGFAYERKIPVSTGAIERSYEILEIPYERSGGDALLESDDE